VAAAGLADVGAGDAHPLEALRGGDHLLEQDAVGVLQPGPLRERAARFGDPAGEPVANRLQLAEPEDPGSPRSRRDPVRDLDVPEGLAEEPGQLRLQPPDLPAQLDAGKTLVGPYMEKAVVEQLPHSPWDECR
jgi:hypothetical protein